MTDYVGRFAPSPSGPLHFGSLVAAVASFCDARAHHGKWLVRIEDIDTPRCQTGADKLILDCLQAHELHWDEEVVYQSQRLDLYHEYVDKLRQRTQVYWCTCNRQRLKTLGGDYDGLCREQGHSYENAALRVHINEPTMAFHDLLLGEQTSAAPICDPIIVRRDGLFAYNLVVVVDDIEQGVNHVVRGSDILPVTPLHLSLANILTTSASTPSLDTKIPAYMHLPVACVEPGRKLSKQNHAPALDNEAAKHNVITALNFLGQALPDDWQRRSLSQIIDYAISHWQRQNVPKCMEVIVAE